MKIKYMGDQPTFQYPVGSTVGGAVSPLPNQLIWHKGNNWIIDTTVAPWSSIPTATWTQLLLLPFFKDVTSSNPVPPSLFEQESTAISAPPGKAAGNIIDGGTP